MDSEFKDRPWICLHWLASKWHENHTDSATCRCTFVMSLALNYRHDSVCVLYAHTYVQVAVAISQ